MGPVEEERVAFPGPLVLDPRIVLQEVTCQRADSYSWFLRWFLGWVGVLGLGGWGGVTFYPQEQGEASSWAASFPEKASVRQTWSLVGGGSGGRKGEHERKDAELR